jgi:hypothetical protein
MKQEHYALYLDGFAWTSSSLFGKQRILCASGTGYLDSHFFSAHSLEANGGVAQTVIAFI